VIRFAVADLVVVAADVLGLDTTTVLDVLDLDAAERALADPEPPGTDLAVRAAVLLHGLLDQRPLPRGNRRVALIATAQFLAVNGRLLDLEPAEETVRVLRAVPDVPRLAAWIRDRTCPVEPEGKPMSLRSRGKKEGPISRLDKRARRVVVLAQEEARLHRHNYIGTEHLLLGLLHEGHGVAARALRASDVELEDVRDVVQKIIGCGGAEPPGHIPFTPRAKRVLELARREAEDLDQPAVATEHLLLGLLREGGGVAAQVLTQLGLRLDGLRRLVLRLAGEPGPTPSAELDELRRATDAAIDDGDFRRAADLRAQQRELLGDDAESLQREITRLRRLLLDSGIDPDRGTRRSA
jgi:hypothetical protein